MLLLIGRYLLCRLHTADKQLGHLLIYFVNDFSGFL